MPSTSLSKSRLESLLVISPASAKPEKSIQKLALQVIFVLGRVKIQSPLSP